MSLVPRLHSKDDANVCKRCRDTDQRCNGLLPCQTCLDAGKKCDDGNRVKFMRDNVLGIINGGRTFTFLEDQPWVSTKGVSSDQFIDQTPSSASGFRKFSDDPSRLRGRKAKGKPKAENQKKKEKRRKGSKTQSSDLFMTTTPNRRERSEDDEDADGADGSGGVAVGGFSNN